jgi:recombination protein RecT
MTTQQTTETKKTENGLQAGSNDHAGVMSARDFLWKNKSKLESTLRGIPYDRFANVVLNSMRRVPKLADCSASSLIAAIGICAELGLEPGGPLGHAYLVPYGGKCELIIGYRGYLHLMYRNGSLKDAEAHIVFEKEVKRGDFVGVRGMATDVKHKITFGEEKGKPVGVYCILRFANGGVHVETMEWEEVMRIKARSRAREDGPWVTDELEMAKKTCLRRAAKWAPTGPDNDMSKAMDADYDVVDSSAVPAAAAPVLPSETSIAPPTVDSTAKAAAAVAAAQGDLTDKLKQSLEPKAP